MEILTLLKNIKIKILHLALSPFAELNVVF
jgi:hypothetical protein